MEGADLEGADLAGEAFADDRAMGRLLFLFCSPFQRLRREPVPERRAGHAIGASPAGDARLRLPLIPNARRSLS
ncbi:hypothetical protein [uncultured Alsobacter sp.]|uniref:hypothetical protein n=1 Tax=uncultured Alsobacter sp. TaxID=1748258 RepID=UPI00345CDF87